MEHATPRGFGSELRHFLSSFFAGTELDPRHERTFEVLFRLLGHLARIDGVVSPEERELVGGIMEETALPIALRERALRAYADSSEADLRSDVERYLNVFPAGSAEVAALFENLVRLALADGRVDAAEQAFLEQLAKWLGIPASYLDWKLQALRAAPPT